MRGEFTAQQRSINEALADARAAGYVGKDVMGSGYGVDIWTHKGAGAYICGEESALLESLEGKRGYPRNRPPFPAIVGAFGCPTVVNNVETLANVPHIINRGADWYKAIGPEKSPGTKLVCVSGHVNKPGLYELPMGTPMKEIIYDLGGGILDGKTLKGVIPGGSSFPVLNKEEAERAIFDFDSMRTIGSAMGSGVVIVIHEDTCMIDMLLATAHFYHHESCGQCTPCREGTGWIEKIMHEMEAGQGKIEQLELLNNISDNMVGNTICVLADSIAMPVKSYVAKFRGEFEEHIRLGRCPFKTASARQAA
jgi:NADH-quinone oxidoreductase subunit F